MKIQRFEVTGLHGNEELIVLEFNEDLNILSGRNGAGKTTILKLMWYLISGNFDKAVAEINFSSAILTTDKYTLQVTINFDNKEVPFSSLLNINELSILKHMENDERLTKFVGKNSDMNIGWFLTQYIDSSFFMPTFRMIEGGFTTEKYDIKHDVIKELYLNLNSENDYNDISLALKKLSNNLTKKEHQFITSISAKEIDIFLVKKYAEIMKKVNFYQTESVQLLSKKIKIMFRNQEQRDADFFESLNKRINFIQKEIKSLNEPLEKIKSAVKIFIPFFRIEFDQKIYFSKIDKDSELEKNNQYILENSYFEPALESIDTNIDKYLNSGSETHFDSLDFENINTCDNDTITINNLSAGEKQLLTFVAYNIFHNDTIFFIDEPELSLHVDWQNRLFSILKEQNPTNQFIISTHSPFIYSLFPDKELVINYDKGCTEY